MIGFQELARATGVLESGQKANAVTGFVHGASAVFHLGLMVLWARWKAAPDDLVHAMDFFTIVIIVAAFLGIMSIYVLTFPRFRSEQVMAAFFSFIYSPVLMSFVYRTRMLPYGIFMYALIFICSSVCDTCALAAGMMFGKHKMAPVLSPKKTIEGAVGGVAGSTLVSWLLSLALSALYPQMHLQLEFILLGICGGLISMIGDLAASAIKRSHNIKDYGRLIPGHGGIMDRFDSIIFTAPVIYYLAVLLIGKV
jgi:phosphatidate cytidylyltransferase